VVSAVAAGGITTFNCGADPVTIAMTATAKVHNNTGRTVLDGGGKVTLSGGGKRRILYMNTCDSSLGRSRSDCLYQTDTQLIVQNLTFVDGNSTGDMTEDGGGGAILVRGGRLKVINSRFQRNRCDPTGPDLGGAAIRITIQYHSKPNYIVDSTFGGAKGQGGTCSNGGAISGLHASLAVYNSVLTYNTAIGNGANPARSGTPGGGSGGAIYTDGNNFTVGIYGSLITDNHAREGGGAIFMVSNNRTGTLTIDSSTVGSATPATDSRTAPESSSLARASRRSPQASSSEAWCQRARRYNRLLPESVTHTDPCPSSIRAGTVMSRNSAST
jgi:hypothetical protein